MMLQDHLFSGSSWFFGLVRTLRQYVPNQVAGLVTWYKIDLSVLSDTTVSVSILYLVLDQDDGGEGVYLERLCATKHRSG